MNRPDFDSIKTYEEFKKYTWYRNELSEICRDHGLFFVGTEKKLNKVIEAYFNGVKIPPRRTWYSNTTLNSFVNENGVMIPLNLFLTALAVFLLVKGIINFAEDPDEAYYALYLSFGVPCLIIAVMGIQVDKDIEFFRSYRPICGDKRFSRAQVDEQANSGSTVYLGYDNILLAPDMLIGVTKGITAVSYEDIASLRVKQCWHSRSVGTGRKRKSFEYYTYKIIVKTKKGRRLVISDCNLDPEAAVKYIYEHCRKYNPDVKLLAMKKSVFAPDDSVKEVTYANRLKNDVENAMKNMYITKISVDEDLKKRFIRFHLLKHFSLIPKAALVSAVAAVVLYFLLSPSSLSGYVLLIIGALLFPGCMALIFLSTLRSVLKGDMDFYSAEVVHKDENGYTLRGIDFNKIDYIKKLKPAREPDVGEWVILARLADGFSLIADNK